MLLLESDSSFQYNLLSLRHSQMMNMPVKKTLTRKTVGKPATSNTNSSRPSNRETVEKTNIAPVKKTCFFCDSKKQPTYTDIAILRKFFSDRSRIMPKQRTGACSKHQRGITKELKYARHLGMLPFVNKV